jgi:hypothetical protein
MDINNHLNLGLLESLTSTITPPATPSHIESLHNQPMHAESSFGYLTDIQDALIVVQLCLVDKLPLVRRRLTMFERESIRSGSIFAFIESHDKPVTPHQSPISPYQQSSKKAKDWQPMRRWTDGLAWSKSRVHGHFLVYKEVAEKRSVTAKRGSTTGNAEEELMMNDTYAPTKKNGSRRGVAMSRVPSLVKQDGLMKKTFSIIVDENVWHVVSYSLVFKQMC